MQLKRTVGRTLSGLWGDEPQDDENDVAVARVADFDYQCLRVRSVPTLRNVPKRLQVERRLRVGDLLIEKSGGGEQQNVGRVVLWTHGTDAITSNFIAVLRPALGFDPRFLSYLHRALYVRGHAAAATKQTTGIQNLDLQAYLSVQVALPDLAHQAQIADFLDRECALIAALSAELGAVRSLIRQGLVSTRSALLRGYKSNTTIGRVTQCLDGRRVPMNAEERSYRQGPYPYWGANSIQGYVDHYLFDEPLVLVGEDGAPFFDAGRDVAWTVEGKVWINNHAHVLRPLSGYTPEFLVEALNAVDYSLYITGATRDKLTQADLNSIRIPEATVADQRQVGMQMKSLRERATRALDEIMLLERCLSAYRDALITEAVTGQLDVSRVSDAQMDESARAAIEGERPEVLLA